MAPRVSAEVLAAIALMRADPALTAYKATQQAGLSPATLYNSKLYKALVNERNAAASRADSSGV